MRNAEGLECGRVTRRRPIGRDYAAAKDAECGKEWRWQVGKDWKSEVGMRNAESGKWKVERR